MLCFLDCLAEPPPLQDISTNQPFLGLGIGLLHPTGKMMSSNHHLLCTGFLSFFLSSSYRVYLFIYCILQVPGVMDNSKCANPYLECGKYDVPSSSDPCLYRAAQRTKHTSSSTPLLLQTHTPRNSLGLPTPSIEQSSPVHPERKLPRKQPPPSSLYRAACPRSWGSPRNI